MSDTFLLYFIKKGSSGIKLYYKLISYTHTHTHIPGVEIKKISLIIKKIKVKKVMLRWKLLFITFYFIIATACVVFIVAKLVLYIVRLLSWSKPLIWCCHVNSFLISNKYNNFWSTHINCMLKITYRLKPRPFQDNLTHFQVKSRPLPG